MKRIGIVLVLVLAVIVPGSAFAAWPDEEPLNVKLNASGIAYASYWAAPSATPTPAQLALAKAYVDGRGDISRYLTVLARLNGLTEESPYLTVKAWLDAREPELIKLFGLGQ
jgi:hypothetical protein